MQEMEECEERRLELIIREGGDETERGGAGPGDEVIEYWWL